MMALVPFDEKQTVSGVRRGRLSIVLKSHLLDRKHKTIYDLDIVGKDRFKHDESFIDVSGDRACLKPVLAPATNRNNSDVKFFRNHLLRETISMTFARVLDCGRFQLSNDFLPRSRSPNGIRVRIECCADGMAGPMRDYNNPVMERAMFLGNAYRIPFIGFLLSLSTALSH